MGFVILNRIRSDRCFKVCAEIVPLSCFCDHLNLRLRALKCQLVIRSWRVTLLLTSYIRMMSCKKVPNGLSCCHTKRMIGMATRAHPSFGMTPTQAIRDLWAMQAI